jgi:5-methylcytosine-specific restriction endonuclease McrA
MKNKSFLIDTILNNFPIPEVYIQVLTDKDGDTKYLVVDGQQRMRAILDFIEGEYSLLDKEGSQYPNMYFKDLPDGAKQLIWNYPIVTRELQTDDPEEVKEVFRRLNKYVVPLNEQELRNATYSGHFANMVNDIADKDEFWADNRIVRASEIKRMLDAEFISELFIGMISGIQAKEQEKINTFYKLYNDSFPNKDDKKREFDRAKNTIYKILGDDLSKSRWHLKNDFFPLFLAICELEKTYHIPAERYIEMKECLLKFSSHVDVSVSKSMGHSLQDTRILLYSENVKGKPTHKTERQNCYNIVRELLIPFCIAKDSKRGFTEEERRIAWNLSKDRKCAICNQEVKSEDYQLDHIVPHNKGGKTELKNSQITHKSCNSKKSDKI